MGLRQRFLGVAGAASPPASATKPLGWVICGVLWQCLVGAPASANAPVASESAVQPELVVLDSAPPAHAPPPAPSAHGDAAELAAVESVMGRRMGRPYAAYLAMTQHNPNLRFGFAEYLLDEYESRKISGIVLAGVVAPILASLTALGVYQFYRHGVRDDGGFCNQVYYNEFRDEYDTNCKGDRGEVAGMILVSSVGGIATLAVLIPGVVRGARYGKRVRQLRRVVARGSGDSPDVAFSYRVGVGQLAAGFRF